MLMTSEELEKKLGLDHGYINGALIHENCPRHYIEGEFFARYEVKDAVEAIRAYHKYEEKLLLDKLSMWKDRANRFEAALVELG